MQREHHNHRLPITLLCGAALLLMWPVLIGRVFLPLDIVPHLHPWAYSYERVPVNNPINSDLIRQIYPRRLVANSIIQQGAWPLWNPTILTGTPLLADGQLALFYPPSLLFLFLPLQWAFGVYALVQLILAGIGSYVFARLLKLGAGPAVLVGLCYMFSGFALTWLQFPEFSGAVAMLPWCFWSVGRACIRLSWRAWTLAAVVLALPLVTQIQLAFYTFSGVTCYVLWQVFHVQSWQVRRRIIVGFGAAVLLALALSAVQLLPELALSAQGQRADVGSTLGSAESYFSTLLRLVFPLIGGKPRTSAALGPAVIQVPLPYAGLLPLLLALLVLPYSRHSAGRFFALLALGTWGLAIGSPLIQLLLTLIPPYRQFIDHSRWFVLWGFAVAVLAGMGAQAIQERRQPFPAQLNRYLRNNRLLALLLVLLLAGWTWQHLALWTPASRYSTYLTLIRQQPLRIPLLAGACGLVAFCALAMARVPRHIAWGLMFATVLGDVLWYSGSYNTFSSPTIYQPTTDLTSALATLPPLPQRTPTLYPPTRQSAFLLSQPQPFRILAGDYPTLLTNLASTWGLEDIRGYQSLYLARYNRLARLVDGKDYTRQGEGLNSFHADFTSAYQGRGLLDMLNVAYIVFPPGSANPEKYASLELVQSDDEGSIYRNPQVLPRAWLVHQAETIPDDDAQLAHMAQPDFDPANGAILAVEAPSLQRPPTPEPVPTLQYAPNQLRVQATVSAAALLVVSDAYTEDWQVTVDGQVARLYRANYALRGVSLAPGEHEVVFTYRPRSFVMGSMVSLCVLLSLIVGSISRAAFRRRRR